MIELIHAHDDSRCEIATHLDDDADTVRLGTTLAAGLHAGLVIHLVGDLGAGKTTLVRGCLRGLGFEGKVKSPTYTLVEPYAVSRLDLYHFDFYRFNQADEYLDAGLDEYFSGTGACLVEWAEKAMPYVAEPDVEVRLEVAGPGRQCVVSARTEAGRKCVTLMNSALQRMLSAP